MKIHGVGQISISVTDVDRAVEFYRDTLGIDFLFQVPGTNPMAFFNCAGTRLYINQPENPEESGTVCHLLHKSIPPKIPPKRLTARGVTIESEPHIIHQTDNYTLWMAFFKRPGRQSHGRDERRGRFDGLARLASKRRATSREFWITTLGNSLLIECDVDWKVNMIGVLDLDLRTTPDKTLSIDRNWLRPKRPKMPGLDYAEGSVQQQSAKHR